MLTNRVDSNYYSAASTFCSTSSGAGFTLVGFPATALRVLNTCEDDAYLSLGSSASLASSNDVRIRACSEVFWSPLPPFSAFSGYSTGGNVKLNITALGG